ncbi:Prephenate dehydratase-domain-containing protein [Myxozyma melibiosi]|uniref:Prephenate dehydratase-domain-containing protein n=1 Tax=Myxozyma melibiosi TaxID=54550 RepID=A0ABR1FB53_9ASCO
MFATSPARSFFVNRLLSRGFAHKSCVMTASAFIGYLGPPGTYSQQAVTQHFGREQDSNGRYAFVPLQTIADCFVALKNGRVAFAVVPFSNSTNGAVNLTYDLLRTADPRPSVIARIDVPVAHCVLASPATIKQIDKQGESTIKRIYSHPQVWTQCTRYLSEHFVGAEQIDQNSTALAAQLASTEANTIAIASIAACDTATVDVYRPNIQDVEGNYTRFLVLEPYLDGQVPCELDKWVEEELQKS